MNGKQKHKKIYKDKSNIDGNGIFAKKDIKKGEIIALIKGPIINHVVVDKKTSTIGPNWIGIGKNKRRSGKRTIQRSSLYKISTP